MLQMKILNRPKLSTESWDTPLETSLCLMRAALRGQEVCDCAVTSTTAAPALPASHACCELGTTFLLLEAATVYSSHGALSPDGGEGPSSPAPLPAHPWGTGQGSSVLLAPAAHLLPGLV